MGRFAYVAVAIALCVFGFVGILSIGAPFLLTGLAMLVVYPWRRGRAVLWPALVAPWAFSATYVLLAPLSCSTSGSTGPLLSRTACSNVLGIDYSGGVGYDPPLLPAFLGGLMVAVVAAVGLRSLLVRHSSS